MSDYVPDSFQNLRDWAENLDTEIAIQAAALGLTPARVTAFQALAVAIRDAAEDVLDKQDALDTAVGDLRSKLSATLPALRLEVNNIKATAGYNPGIGDALGIVGSSSTFDPATYQPVLKASAYPGYIRLMGTKRGADSLNLYTRLQGQAAWTLLAAKRMRFPYDDDAPLKVPGTPEVREYRAIGLRADSEVGQLSDIVTATFAG